MDDTPFLMAKPSSMEDEIEWLKADHIAAHRVNVMTIRHLEAEIERLRGENEKLWDVVMFLEDHEPDLVGDAIEKTALRQCRGSQRR